ncbi:MAG: hypothetical protein HY757_03065 [Nitrospirae bacterium]|nr:hypothetical protein [Nitrospirota bacterium]
MPDRKSLNKEIDSIHQVTVLQNRRMDEVKKNFAVGIQRVFPGRKLNGGLCFKTTSRN